MSTSGKDRETWEAILKTLPSALSERRNYRRTWSGGIT